MRFKLGFALASAMVLFVGVTHAAPPSPGAKLKVPQAASRNSVATALAATPEVFRCKTAAEFNSYGCVDDYLPSPFDASAFDHGVGAHISFDGVVQVYELRFTYPDGSGALTSRYTYVSTTSSSCAGGYVSLGTCFYGGVYDLAFTLRKPGQWKIELLADSVLQWTAQANVKAGIIKKLDGDGSSAPIGETVRPKPKLSLRHFDDTTVDISESRWSTLTDTIDLNITGPSKATGMWAGDIIYGDNAASEEFGVGVGDKTGAYPVTGTMQGATMPSPFTFNAVGQQAAADHPDFEEDNGKSCGVPGDPDLGTVGDPVTIGRGNSFQQEVDYERAGISLLEFVRSYNAQGSKSRLMRNYWTTTYDRFVILPVGAGQPAKVRRPDGRTITFNDYSGSYRPRAYFESTLVKSGTTWKYTDTDQTVELYDSQGRLLSITDAVGRSITATFNSAGNLTKVTANTGESLAFVYNSYGQMTTMTDNGGRVWTYQYDGYTNLRQAKRPDGTLTNYSYEDPLNPHLLTSTAGSHSATWVFDAQGRVVSNFYPGGLKKVDITYLPDGRRIVADSLGRSTTYRTHLVSGKSFVDGAVGPGFASCGLTDAQLEYDADMNVTARTSFGRRTEFGGFDAKGQNAFLIEAAGTTSARRTDYQYDARFIGKPTRIRSPSVVPGRLKVVEYEYNAAGNVTRETVSGFRPDGIAVARTTALQYAGPFGQLSQVDGPRTDVSDLTVFQYDATTKRLKQVTSPDGIVLRKNLAYNSSGQVVSEERPNGLKLTYTYRAGTNLLGTLTETHGTSVRTTTWTYTPSHQVESITIGDGVNPDIAVSFVYDAAGQLTSVDPKTKYQIGTYPRPVVQGYSRDSEGNVLRDAKGTGSPYGPVETETQWLQRTFDAYNRVDRLITAIGTTDYDFHPDGSLTQVTDGKNQITSYEYDDFKRMTKIIQPGQVTSSFAYDSRDNLVKVTDPNLGVTQYSIDDLGNHLQLDSPDTGTTRHSHDGAGNVTQTVDAKGQAVTRTYSAGDRLLTVDRPGSSEDETFAYDNCQNGVGRLCSITSGNGEYVAYDYDGFGRPSLVATRNGGVGYQYDAKDNVAAIIYPSGRTVRYTRGAGAEISAVKVTEGLRTFSLAANVKHLPMGPAESWTYGNGLQEFRQYNSQYLPVSQGIAGKFSISYPQYDANGNLLQRVVNGTQETYTYDPLDRLKTASGAFGLRSYDYDSVGNRTQLIADGVTSPYTYSAQSNRMVSDSTWDYSLDANGNVRQKQNSAGLGEQYGHTVRNQLETVAPISAPAGQSAVYVYNALGQRTLKSTNGQERKFIYGLGGELLSETLADGSIVEEYVYLEGQPLALLGSPYVAPAPPLVDAIVDDVPKGSPWVLRSSSSAYGGKYQTLTVATPYGDDYVWNWTPPYSGYYDMWVWWMRRSNDGQATHYLTDGGYSGTGGSNIAVGHASQTLGAWTYLGRHHLTTGQPALLLIEYLHGIEASLDSVSVSGGSLAVDAARFKLVEQDSPLAGNYRFIVVDQIGTPQAAMDKAGKIIWNAVYDPFGAATVNGDPDNDGQVFTLNLRFPGQYFDAETGLHYNYFRDYDPAIGRYIESDPIGLNGGASTYGYANQQPLSASDPFGLEAELILFSNTQDKKFYDRSMLYNSPKGTFTVAAHGIPSIMSNSAGPPLTAQALYDLVKNRADFKAAKVIQFASCESGKTSVYGVNMAEDFARLSGKPVRATDHFILWQPDGRIFLGEPTGRTLRDGTGEFRGRRDQSWLLFEPGKPAPSVVR